MCAGVITAGRVVGQGIKEFLCRKSDTIKIRRRDNVQDAIILKLSTSSCAGGLIRVVNVHRCADSIDALSEVSKIPISLLGRRHAGVKGRIAHIAILLIISKEECFVLQNRSADGTTKIVESRLRLTKGGARKCNLCIQHVIAEELVQAPVKLIAARP